MTRRCAAGGRSGLRRALAALLSAVFVLGGTPLAGTHLALAAGGDADMAAALNKFDAGRKAFDSGAFEEALLAFQASQALSASPNSRLYIGRCYRALGKVASAYTAFRFASREAAARLTATHEKRYGATRDAATKEAADLEPKVPRLTIAVPGGVPEGFAIKENGEDVPKAAWGIAVETDPGDITLEATGPRLVPFKKVIALAEGAQERVDVEVKRMPTAVITLALKTRPSGVEIAIDGAPIDLGDLDKPREVDVGEHAVTVDAPGYVPFHWTQTLADGDKVEVDAALAPDAIALAGKPKGTPKWLFFTVGGAAAATLGVASVIALHANSQQNAELAKDVYSRSSTTRDSIRSEATTANVLFVAGGVVAIGTAVLGFTTQWKSEKPSGPSVGFNPWIAPTGAGLGANGHF